MLRTGNPSSPLRLIVLNSRAKSGTLNESLKVELGARQDFCYSGEIGAS